MNSTKERRESILEVLMKSSQAISGSALAKMYGVSRQVIVQDISILKSTNNDIISTNKGYKILQNDLCQRVFKVSHSYEEIETELTNIVDLGGRVHDVFIWHRAYGKILASLDIKSRRDVKHILIEFEKGISKPLCVLTDGYHYHTVSADSEEILDEIEAKLDEIGMLIKGDE